MSDTHTGEASSRPQEPIDRVAGLVYIAALAPDADETSQSQQNKFPVTDVFKGLCEQCGTPDGIEFR